MVSVAPLPIRIWLGESDNWYLPATTDAELLPWRLIVESVAPLPTIIAVVALIGALAGVIGSMVARSVSQRREISRSLFWASSMLVPWLMVLGACATLAIYRNHDGAAFILIIALLAITTALPWLAFRVDLAARPLSQPRPLTPFRVHLEAVALIGISWLLGWVPEHWNVLGNALDFGLTFLLIGLLMRGQPLGQLLGERSWLSVRWVLDRIAMHALVALSLVPLAAWLLWLNVWLIYEAPQIRDFNNTILNVPKWMLALGSVWHFLLFPVMGFMLYADGRLAWLHGVGRIAERSEPAGSTELSRTS